MILLTPTLGSRNYFHPESPLLQMIACCTRSFRRCYSMFYRDTCAHRLCKFTTTETSLWIATYTCHPYLHSRLLLLVQDTLKFSLLFQEYFVPAALQFLATWIPLTDNSSWFIHPQLFMRFTKYFEMPFDLPRILYSLVILRFLLPAALWLIPYA